MEMTKRSCSVWFAEEVEKEFMKIKALRECLGRDNTHLDVEVLIVRLLLDEEDKLLKEYYNEKGDFYE